jgi:ankyrin repeat protein
MSASRSLPPRPDMRHLRDEAKRRRRAGEFPSLALAHYAIAQEYGFRSWARLKFHVDALTLDAAERAQVLIAAVGSADLRRARALLDADPALARHDLACACATGEHEEVARRLAARPQLATEPTGPDGWEPILYACFSRLLRGDPQRAVGIRRVVRLLLDAGADPNAAYVKGEWLQVALYGAAGIAGDIELTRMLLEAGASPTDEREGLHGNEVLYHACELRDPTCARLVIEAGAAQHLLDYDLGRALNFDNPEMIEVFCNGGAQPHAAHLHQAVWRRRPARTVAALLDAGAPIDAPDERGLTPLQIAELWGESEVAALLRTRGAAPVAPAEVVPQLLDEMLILSIQGGHLETMQRLLDAGARVDGDPDGEDVPLGQACWRGRAAMVRELVARGAALSFPDGGSAIGATLHGSQHCQEGEGGPTMGLVDEIATAPYAEIVRMLLAAGAPVPERLGEGGRGQRATAVMAELGVAPPT